MILEFFIENYRSIREEVHFSMLAESTTKKEENVAHIEVGNKTIRVLRAAAIYGHNASGKSNIMRALFYNLSFITNTQITIDDSIKSFDPFKFNTFSSKQPSRFEINFIGIHNVRYNYIIKYNQREIILEELNYYPNGRRTNIFKRDDIRKSDTPFHTATLGNTWDNEKITLFPNQAVIAKGGKDFPHEEISQTFSYFNKIMILNALNEKHINYYFKNNWKGYNEKPEVTEKLNRLIRYFDLALTGIKQEDDESSSSSLENENKIEYGVHNLFDNNGKIQNRPVYLPLKEESHGTKTIYQVGGAIISALEEGRILLIDELETSLHPLVVQVFVKLFLNKRTNPHNAQLIFTTHESNLMKRELMRKDQIWFTEKNVKGETECFSLQDFDEVREDTPFDRWYLMGKLGGVKKMGVLNNIFDDPSKEG